MGKTEPDDKIIAGFAAAFFLIVLAIICAIFGVGIWAVIELVQWITSK